MWDLNFLEEAYKVPYGSGSHHFYNQHYVGDIAEFLMPVFFKSAFI
ncbi:hypothetical protein SBA2_10038 [Acidobacteriia bacterium SbA2]|nr:hypothetical protein SBA2_10038 [Acidobacteriia bacterium SbA2]